MFESHIDKTLIFNELDDDDNKFWFDYKRDKFLHNIDTFYYSIKLQEDFTKDSIHPNVLKFRDYFRSELDKAKAFDVQPITFENLDIKGKKGYAPKGLPSYLILKKSNFALFYDANIQRPDFYDFFFALTVPNFDTSEIIVQIRSYYLWLHGVRKAFDDSLKDIKFILDLFGLTIVAIHENRCDYCWHTNYIQNTAQFLAPDNIAKMRVSSLGKDADAHMEFKGDSDYEIDYFRFGRLKSNNILFRIYLKSKEVVEMGYKSFFFKIWLLNGIINRYDMYVYEECYKLKNWGYLNMARLMFYAEFGSDDFLREKCQRLIDEIDTLDYDALAKFADELTPKVTLVLNLEFQTMRKFSRSIECLPFKENRGVTKRVYDYFDNRKIIIDYLTHNVFRFVKPHETDVNKSRWDYTAFWQRLRNTKMVDTYVKTHDIKLVRQYAVNLDMDVVKHRALNSLVTYDIYNNGVNDDFDFTDRFLDFICTLNDNDMEKSDKYRDKKIRLLGNKVDGLERSTPFKNFCIVDKDSGEIISK